MSALPQAEGALGVGWRAAVGDYARCLAWDAAGRQLLVGDAAGTLSCLDAATGRLRWETPAHRGGVLALSAHPSRALVASAGADGRACLWDLDDRGDGRLIGAASADAGVEALAWQPHADALAAIDAAGGVGVWSITDATDTLAGV